MRFLTQNRILTQNRPFTVLTAAVAAAGTTLTVKAVDTNAWADNDWIIVGEIGTQNAEIMQINGAVSDGTSLTIDNAGSGGLRFAHSIDEPVYRVDYNKYKVYRATTVDGSKTLLATQEVQPDFFESMYEDSANATGYGFVAFFNSFTNAQSPYSDAIPYTGQSLASLAKMISKVRSLTDEESDEFISDSEITNAINDKQRDILSERLWTFNEAEYSTPGIQYQFDYAKPSQLKTIHTMRYATWPLRNISQARWEMLHWDTNQNTTTPTHVAIFEDKARIYPTPQASSQTTQLNGAITASDTTITVDSTDGFLIGDYYRFTIDSEVIYATFADEDNEQFTGCLRGQEGTTAASHLDNATVTQNDIVFTGQLEPVDLDALNDETIIPEPIVVCYGVATDFCMGKLNKETLGDRYQIKYTNGIEGLRNKYTLKFTSQFGRVRDPKEVISDNGRIENPNDFPQNVIAPPLV